MRLKFVLQMALSCLFVAFIAAGCASTDESVKARLAILELKLDALEDQRDGATPLKVDKVTPQEATSSPSSVGDAPSDVVNTIPGRATVVQPPVQDKPHSAPAPASEPVKSVNRVQPAGDGVVFLSQSAYADLTGAAPVGAPAKSSTDKRNAGTKGSDSGKNTRDVKKEDGKKQNASASSAQTKPKIAPSTPAPRKPQDVSAYEAALRVVLSGKTAEGRQKMNEFISRHPGSKLEPNALYWVGETWYSDKSYDTAILVFKDITTKFPKHDKASAALYKLGACYEQLRDKGNARFYWQALVEDFPKSEAAGLARKKLAVQ